MPTNQNPEQVARGQIDKLLQQVGWTVQNKTQINFHVGQGQAVREYQTDTGPADYILFVDGKPVGVIEAKAEQHGHKLTAVEEQTAEYAAAKLKWVSNNHSVRKHRRDHPFYRCSRSQTALARSVRFSPPGHLAGMAKPKRLVTWPLTKLS